MQHTLTNSVIFKGIGLHSGAPVTMIVHPAGVDEGIKFTRQDVEGVDNIISARYDMVEQSQLCTLLKNESGTSVSTVEHVMAAFVGCGIDNATVILDGPEAPIMDGSSLPFVEKFMEVGVESLHADRQAIKILKPVEVHGKDGSYARFEPDTQSVFEFTIDFDNRFIQRQTLKFTLGDNHAFLNELADCPTFTTLDQIEQLRSMGLIKGGSEENADIYTKDSVIRGKNREGKRRLDAAVRHKMLDALGDCGLAGAPIIGRYICEKGGHALTNQLLRTLFANPAAYMFVIDHLGVAQHSEKNQSSSPNPAYNA